MNARRAKPAAAVDTNSPCRCGSARIAVGPVGSCWTVTRTARSISASGSLPGWWPHTGDPVRCADVFTAINTFDEHVLKGRAQYAMAQLLAGAHMGKRLLQPYRIGRV